MASSRVEFGSCVLSRPSTPGTTTRNEKNNKGFLHSCIASTNSGNTCADFESENWKNQNNVDLSWLPDHFDIKRSGSTTASKSINSNCSRETENDSWLPSTSENDDSWLPNYNDVKRNTSTVPSKPNNLNRSLKTENGSNYSKRVHDQIQHAKPLNKKPESSRSQGQVSSSKSNCSVETDSLGIASINSANTCAQNNVDLSWLPNYDVDNSASESHHHNGEIEFHYSWLPDHIDIKRIGSPAASKSSNSNRSSEPENDSWLPSTPIVNSENDDSWLPNYNDVKKNTWKIPSKPNNLNRSLKTENGSNCSKPLNKKPESSRSQGQVSSSKANCVVETESLGGVSTLLRRFQQVAGENKCLSHVTGKHRLIRGRQAYNDFLNLIEQDKQRELESLAKRKPVSHFSHRGRIRALLRFRFIQQDAEPKTELKTLKPESITTSNQSAKEAMDHHQISESTNPAKDDVDASSPSTQGSNDAIQFETPHDWSSEYSQSQSDWDEEEEEDFDDWISEIARPRRYWECMRQARYHEMLHLYSHKEDLRELLERRCVAGFLSSGLRDNIDQLMVSRAEGMELRKEDMEAEEDEDGDEDDWSRLERECREYNEFIKQTTALEERSNVIYDSYQSSSSSVSSCKQVLISY